MQGAALDKPVVLPAEQPESELGAAINAAITARLVDFYNHLVSTGSIKPLPTDGPSCGLTT